VSIIEAMALGFPIISTNVGGLPYLIEDEKDGLLVAPNIVNAMTEAIIKLLQNPEKVKKFSLNARKKANTLDSDTVKKEWIKILTDVI